MLKNLLLLLSVIAAAYGSGQLVILQAPDAIKIKQEGKLPGSLTGQVIQACLGYSTSVPDLSPKDYDNIKNLGFAIEMPLELPNEAFALRITGISEVPLTSKPLSKIALTGEVSTDSLNNVIGNQKDGFNSISHINFNDANAVKNAKTFCKLDELKDIKSTENADPKTCSQAAAILENVRDCEPSTLTEFTLDLSTLDETARKQCLSLVVPAYEQYVETQASKNPRRIFTIIAESSESVLKRSRRAAENDSKSLNLAVEYSDDYPVIFNIILWFGVLMVFSLLAISYAIGGMDPGRDSIIYRMTSTRIKKDN